MKVRGCPQRRSAMNTGARVTGARPSAIGACDKGRWLIVHFLFLWERGADVELPCRSVAYRTIGAKPLGCGTKGRANTSFDPQRGSVAGTCTIRALLMPWVGIGYSDSVIHDSIQRKRSFRNCNGFRNEKQLHAKRALSIWR